MAKYSDLTVTVKVTLPGETDSLPDASTVQGLIGDAISECIPGSTTEVVQVEADESTISKRRIRL